jgi:hypothetical protein
MKLNLIMLPCFLYSEGIKHKWTIALPALIAHMMSSSIVGDNSLLLHIQGATYYYHIILVKLCLFFNS